MKPTGIRVLFTDSDPIMARHFARELEADGHTVVHVASVRAAWELIERERFDTAVIDVELRGELRGVHLALTLYSKRDVPVILTGGTAQASGLKELFFPSLVKPFDGEILRAKLREVLEDHYGRA